MKVGSDELVPIYELDVSKNNYSRKINEKYRYLLAWNTKIQFYVVHIFKNREERSERTWMESLSTKPILTMPNDTNFLPC